MLWIGLTGGIATGKSTVAKLLQEMQIPVIDADQIAHLGLVDCLDEIKGHFGSGILNSQGGIDRGLLGGLVFNDPQKKEILEKILHPYVQQKVRAIKEDLENKKNKAAVYDVPLLFEKNLEGQFDLILLVYAPDEMALERLMKRNQMDKKQAIHRISQLMNIEEKRKKADHIFENVRDLEFLKQQVIDWKNSFLK